MYFSLSWRNIWRNKKRTIIVAASVFFAVLLASFMRSAQRGSYSYMIHSSAKLYSGYVQIQGQGYWENRSLDKSIVLPAGTQNEIRALPHVSTLTPRLESFALVSFDIHTKVAQVIGINPQVENEMTGLKNRLISGNYLDSDSQGALVAEGLAKLLKVNLGDSVVLYGQGYHGQIAAAKVSVVGIVKLPFQQMNNGLVFLSLTNAQQVYSCPDQITSAAIMVENIQYLDQIIEETRAIIDDQFVMMKWDEMMPDLVQNIELDNASGIIMLMILYIVIAFGVFGTIMMMVSERLKEFGILVSIGMKKWRLILVTTIETIFVSSLGVIAGIVGSMPLVYYLHNNPIPITGDAAKTFESLAIEPIFYFSNEPVIYFSQALVVLIIALATAIYPVLFIRRLKPVEALHA